LEFRNSRKKEKRGKKGAMSPFKALHGNTLQRGPQEEKKTQHITVPSVSVDMGTLLKLARVSMLPC
jgi:hypothetical protein